MRIQSEHPAKDGGWYHEYGDKKPVYIPPKKSLSKPLINAERLNQNFYLNCSVARLGKLSEELDVSAFSLEALQVGWSENNFCYTIPMRDGEDNVIGIHLRYEDGIKEAIPSSRNGLFLPRGNHNTKLAYICEGASNTAALLTMGFFAIGRPSCNSGADMLKVAIKRLGVRNLVIVADNDYLKYAPDNRTFRPGQDGAKKLKKELGLMSVLFTPPNPLKDVRDLLRELGKNHAANYITNSINQKIWTRV